MSNLEKLIVGPDASLREVLTAIGRGSRQVVLVTDPRKKLLATVTDGDIRRGILRGVGLDDPVSSIMNCDFTAVSVAEGRSAAWRLMQDGGYHHITMRFGDGVVVDLAYVDDFQGGALRDTRVVLMAGGLGTRLRPLTEDIPKPMLLVGGRPILETILRSLMDQGFRRFTLAVNYKAEVIQDHFGDGEAIGASIDYVHETQRMGTAGALSLIDERPTEPFVVMNGDLLTSLKFGALVDFHRDTNAAATMCAREYVVQVPYGVIQYTGTSFQDIVEKPVHRHYVNAGIYVLSPEIFDHLEPDTPLDMPDLFVRLRDGGKATSVFPMSDYWIDIGQSDELARARSEFDTNFEGQV